mmetsp:Transcript_12112/g.26037  ORF Transcript_12112/g.26037 Transcript_12112/m.26037 type:complete len:83 (+) Transcript_12112:171-419(+)
MTCILELQSSSWPCTMDTPGSSCCPHYLSHAMFSAMHLTGVPLAVTLWSCPTEPTLIMWLNAQDTKAPILLLLPQPQVLSHV